MANIYDLSSKIIPHVDRHLAIPIVDFLSERKIYDEAGLAKVKHALISETKMIDCLIDEYTKNNNTTNIPAELTESKSKVLKEIETLKKDIGPLAEYVEKAKFEVAREANQLTPEHLSQQGVSLKHVEALYKYGRLMFSIGMYRDANMAFSVYRALAVDDEEMYMALWGKLCAGIVDGENWDAVYDDARTLREAIDSRNKVSQSEQVQHRTWFLHWILFFTFNHASARHLLLDCLNTSSPTSHPSNNEKMLNSVLLSSPHLLRYLTVAAVIASRQTIPHQQYILKRSYPLRELVRILGNEKTYSDPVTRFVHSLLTDFDFEAAAKHLNESVAVLQNDFFLNSESIQKDFFEAARTLMIDTYARIYATVPINEVLTKLNLNIPFVEEIAADVKLDHSAVIKTSSIHQQIRDKARQVSRSNQTQYSARN